VPLINPISQFFAMLKKKIPISFISYTEKANSYQFMTEFDYFKKALSLVVRHTSQVICSIRPALKFPPDVLYGLHDKGLDLINNNINYLDHSDNKKVIVINNVDNAFELLSRKNFIIQCENLPQLTITDCSDFVIDLTKISIKFSKENREKFQIVINKCKNFNVCGGFLEDTRNAIFITDSAGFIISGLRTRHAEGYGIIVFNCNYFKIENCDFSNNLASGVYCLGDTSYGVIEKNNFSGGRGYYNWDAGLHINHCTPQLSTEHIPERSHEARRIDEKILKPTFIYVLDNIFTGNRAQGIYCEGCVLSCFENNIIEKNNKEGICFDWGSALNVFRSNVLLMNGERAKLSAAEIKADFIEHHPTLPDGSSSCKLPGLSIDNGALNILTSNKFCNNYGGGVKMVRTGIGNVVYGNSFLENGIGRNEYFKHYHGVNMLGMGAGKTEFTSGDAKLDFMPSELNFIFSNIYSGNSQFNAVYASRVCPPNNFVGADNFIVSVGGKALSDNLHVECKE